MICRDCHKEEKHFAKNLCKRCYHRQNANQNYWKNPDVFRQKAVEWGRNHPEIIINNNKTFRENNPEYVKQKGREHYNKNPNYYKQKLIEFNINNPGYFKQKMKEFRIKNPTYNKIKYEEFKQQNPDYFRMKGKERYQQNPAFYRQKIDEFRKNNPDYMKNYLKTPKGMFLSKIYKHERREKEKNLKHDFSDDDWFNKINLTKGICPVCLEPFNKNDSRKKMTIDHEPSIKKAPMGFKYKIDNVTPMCKSCNSKKSANNTIKW